jgi:exopolysaccharide biosynthesis protein
MLGAGAVSLSAFGEGKTVKIMMFDGSGSSQMVVDGSLVVPSKDGRGVTTALIVYAP